MGVPSRVRGGLLTAALCGTLAGCGAGLSAKSAPSRRTAPSIGEPRPLAIRPARLLFLPQDSPTSTGELDPDGSRRFIVQGVRVLERADGTLDEALERFPRSAAVH